MAHRISAKQHGGPEVLEYEAYDVPAPGPGEALVRHAAIGLNYIDVYHRTGLYPGALPLTPGMEGAGTVEAVGPGVTDLAPGQRVAYAGAPVGAYADLRVMPAAILVPLPDAISFDTAAAMMLKGMTAQYLLRQTYRVQPGDHDPVPCRRRRGRADRRPVGEASGCGRHRHGQLAGQGRARPRPRLRARHRLFARGLRRPGQGDHRRRGRAGGL